MREEIESYKIRDTMADLYKILADVLETDAVSPEEVLNENENWDSLCVLSIIAESRSQFGVALKAADFPEGLTAGALAELIESRKG